MPFTPSGSFYQWTLSKYREQWAKNGIQVVIQCTCAWDDVGDVRSALCGYTEWTFGDLTLTRTLPYQWPFTTPLYCESAELVDYGFAKGADSHDPTADDWPKGEWATLQCVFTRPPYALVEDAELTPLTGERGRFLSLRQQYNPRERRRPSYVFQTAEADPIPTDEVGFIPDFSVSIYATWWQVPYDAAPLLAIAKAGATVNDTDFWLKGITGEAAGGVYADPEQLLFKGCATPLEPYSGADGGLYFDLIYLFDYRPTLHGWNGYRKNDTSYVRLRLKGSATGLGAGIPPYQSSDFSLLFQPTH